MAEEAELKRRLPALAKITGCEPSRLRCQDRGAGHPERMPMGTSILAASQPRKPEAAQIMDWFYALPPYQWLPPEGETLGLKRPGDR